MNVLVLGAGNLLLSDEGFGVHVIRRMEQRGDAPAGVELLDAGTLGILASSRVEAADVVYVVDALDAPGEPGTILRFDKEDFMLDRIPVKLSPHQLGVQEMLFISVLRGCCPREVQLVGIIPASVAPGESLSPALAGRVDTVVDILLSEIRAHMVPCAPGSRITDGPLLPGA